jgi:hypothetical protein
MIAPPDDVRTSWSRSCHVVRVQSEERSSMRTLSIRTLRWLASFGALMIATTGCGSDSSTPTTPTPVTTTESFSGTVGHLGTSGHSFTVATTGPVTITLISVGPLTTMSMGIGVGIWDGTTCATSSTKNDNVRTGAVALTGTANAGNYCVNVYDSGNVPEDWEVSYEVQVVHP